MYFAGNVAYRKAISAGNVSQDWNASPTVDGNYTDPDENNDHCFVQDNVFGDAWWMVDLGEEHVIYNMTVYTDYRSKYYEYGNYKFAD